MEEYSSEFFEFVSAHSQDDPAKLMLKYGRRNVDRKDSHYINQGEIRTEDYGVNHDEKEVWEGGIDIPFAALQIECRKKYRKKLMPFIERDKFVFPDNLSGEQSSDYRVADYHACLIGTGKRVLDMTAGLGIDCMTAAMTGNSVTAVELDKRKAKALNHNRNVLQLSDFNVINDDSLKFLESSSAIYDVIFIDPARRSVDNKRTYSFSDCTPDIIPIFDQLTSRAHRVMVKASPLLDITEVRRQLKDIQEIHVISVKGECKEVLVIAGRDESPLRMISADLDDTGIRSVYELKRESSERMPLIDTIQGFDYKYLYEPNSSLMKFEASASLHQSFPGLIKLAQNTHLYASDEYYEDFPGRKLQILEMPDKKRLKELKGQRINVATRNYKTSAAELTKKFGLLSGDDMFLYMCRAGSKESSLAMLCSRIK